MILNRKADSQKDYTEYGKKQEIKIKIMRNKITKKNVYRVNRVYIVNRIINKKEIL